MPVYQFIPGDVLFFRDARPMTADAGTGGHGARWPEPSVFFHALHCALHRAWPDKMPWEAQGLTRRDQLKAARKEEGGANGERFQSLATCGPFPERDGQWYFPCPYEAGPDELGGTKYLTGLPMPGSGGGNQPKPLTCGVAAVALPTKDETNPWWSRTAIEAWLAHGSAARPNTLGKGAFFDDEWNTGIAIDPETGTTGHGDAQGKIYAAQYLRLKPEVALGLHATLPVVGGGTVTEGMKELISGVDRIVVGGQQRVCHVKEGTGLENLLPRSQPLKAEKTRVKWLLLTPAIFPKVEAKPGIVPHPGGWLPSWVDAKEGRVLLRKGDTARQPGELREAWRERVRKLPDYDCRLVAASVPKALPLAGWGERLRAGLEEDAATAPGKGARRGRLAVPAGAVYYFEGPDAPLLAEALSWHGAGGDFSSIRHRRSGLCGEQGFGIGVCGPWEYHGSPAKA